MDRANKWPRGRERPAAGPERIRRVRRRLHHGRFGRSHHLPDGPPTTPTHLADGLAHCFPHCLPHLTAGLASHLAADAADLPYGLADLPLHAANFTASLANLATDLATHFTTNFARLFACRHPLGPPFSKWCPWSTGLSRRSPSAARIESSIHNSWRWPAGIEVTVRSPDPATHTVFKFVALYRFI